MNQELTTSRFLETALPDAPEEDTGLPPEPKGPSGWSIYLTIICVMFGLISVLGAVSAAHGIYGLRSTPPPTTVARTEAERHAQALLQVQEDARKKYFPILVYLEILKLGLAAAFMFTLVLLVARNPRGRTMALGICGVALFYHVCNLGMTITMLCETGGVVNSMLDDAFAGSNMESAERESAGNFVRNSMLTFLTIAFSILFMIKLAFYGSIMAYLWSDDVKRIFGEDPLAHLKDGLESETTDGTLPVPT